MLTPEREAEIRKIVNLDPDDMLYKDEALMLLALIDRLRAENAALRVEKDALLRLMIGKDELRATALVALDRLTARLEAAEAVCADYEQWLDDALAALGIKTVFDIKGAIIARADAERLAVAIRYAFAHEAWADSHRALAAHEAQPPERLAEALHKVATVPLEEKGDLHNLVGYMRRTARAALAAHEEEKA